MQFRACVMNFILSVNISGHYPVSMGVKLILFKSLIRIKILN